MYTQTKDMKRVIVGAAFAIWSGAILAAMLYITKYSESPGPAENVPQRWPAQSLVTLARQIRL